MSVHLWKYKTRLSNNVLNSLFSFYFLFGDNGLSFIVTDGPAVRSYGGLPALRADTWVCPYTPHATIPLPSGLFWMVFTFLVFGFFGFFGFVVAETTRP